MARRKRKQLDLSDPCPICGGGDPLDGAAGCRCGRAWSPSTAEDWRFIRHLLATRSGQRCEVCGGRLSAVVEPTVHHRQPRGKGGTSRSDVHNLSNLLLLCGGAMGGIAGCHGWAEANRSDAEARGLIVRHGLESADVAVTLHSGRRVLLDPVSPFYGLVTAPYGEGIGEVASWCRWRETFAGRLTG